MHSPSALRFVLVGEDTSLALAVGLLAGIGRCWRLDSTTLVLWMKEDNVPILGSGMRHVGLNSLVIIVVTSLYA